MDLIGSALRIAVALLLVAFGCLVGFIRAPAETLGIAGLEGRQSPEARFRSALLAPEPDQALSNSLSRQLAAASPLHPLPYQIALASKIEAEDIIGAEPWAQAVLARDPRDRFAHAVGFLQAALEENWDAALDAFAAYRVLRGPSIIPVDQILAAQMADAAVRAAVFQRMEKDKPDWGRNVLKQLDFDTMALSELVQVFAIYPDMKDAFYNQLVREKRYQEAYVAWLLWRDASEAAMQFPTDPTFNGASSPLPFNWSIDASHAERLPGGGLYVYYSGRGRPLILSQLLSLTSGTYRIDSDAEGEVLSANGELVWSLTCTGNGARLLTTPVISPATGEAVQQAARFTIPPTGCDFQTLVMTAVPGEYARPFRITIRSVRIAAVEGE